MNVCMKLLFPVLALIGVKACKPLLQGLCVLGGAAGPLKAATASLSASWYFRASTSQALTT